MTGIVALGTLRHYFDGNRDELILAWVFEKAEELQCDEYCIEPDSK